VYKPSVGLVAVVANLLLAGSSNATETPVVASSGPTQLAAPLSQYGAKLAYGKRRSMAADADPASPAIHTVPNFNGSFDSEGVTYAFTMVGHPPQSNAETSVETIVIPLAFILPFPDANGNPIILDGTSKVANLMESPIFDRAHFSSGHTQFGDALQRATFWGQINHDNSHDGWHVRLSDPHLRPTLYIQVPSEGLFYTVLPDGSILPLIPLDVLDSMFSTITQLIGDADALKMFVTNNVWGYSPGPDGTPQTITFGFHSAVSYGTLGKTVAIDTLVWADWTDPGVSAAVFGPSAASIEDVNIFSHEVAEWLNDPFLQNLVPSYALGGGYAACGNILETGDYLVGVSYPITVDGVTYSLQNQALLQWFAREIPSSAIDGSYSFPDETVLTSVSPVCPAGS
jgi:hypothetical protein